MSRLPVKRLSKVQNLLWNYDTANLVIFKDKQFSDLIAMKQPNIFQITYCFLNILFRTLNESNRIRDVSKAKFTYLCF